MQLNGALQDQRSCSSGKNNKTNGRTALQHSLSESVSMQLCYRNDAASDIDEDEADEDSHRCLSSSSSGGCEWQKFKRPPKSLQICPLGHLALQPSKTEQERRPKQHNRRPLEPELLAACSALNDLLLGGDKGGDGGGGSGRGGGRCGGSGGMELWVSSSDRISAQQARLKAEAELAMAQAQPMARMQLQVERCTLPRPSPTYRENLSRLSLEELQRVERHLLDQIKGLNEELVCCLIDRDSLHMEQDSMLVEVEDLTRRARELVGRLAKRKCSQSVSHSGISDHHGAAPAQEPGQQSE